MHVSDSEAHRDRSTLNTLRNTKLNTLKHKTLNTKHKNPVCARLFVEPLM